MTKNKNLVTNLKSLTYLPSVSGNEAVVVGYLKDKLKDSQISFSSDAKNNLICKKGHHPEKLALIAHMDKEGFIVVSVEKDNLKVVGTHKLEVFTKGPISKVLCSDKSGKTDLGLLVNAGEGINILKVTVKDPKKYTIGDFVCYSSNFITNNNIVQAPYLDNSMGVSVAIEVLKEIKEGTVIFTSLEEVGFQGVGPAIYSVKPEKAIVLDTTYDIESPNGTKLTAGKGPSICIKDKVFGDKSIINELVSLAEENKIPYQLEVWEEANSDMNGFHAMFGGVKCCFVGLPIKNPKAINQIGSVKDMVWAQKLLVKYFKEIYSCL